MRIKSYQKFFSNNQRKETNTNIIYFFELIKFLYVLLFSIDLKSFKLQIYDQMTKNNIIGKYF